MIMNQSNPSQRRSHLWGALLAMTVGTGLTAQPLTDIGLFPNASPNTLEVRLRPDASFNQVVSNLTFTIRWNANAADSLDAGAITQFFHEACSNFCHLINPLAGSGSGPDTLKNSGKKGGGSPLFQFR